MAMVELEGEGATQSSAIAGRIRADIIAGVIPFGTRLTLGQLERQYESGQMPVREALRQLQGEGLVELIPNRGARVRQVDDEFVSNLFDIRIAIEAMLTRRAAERMRPDQAERLADAAAAYEKTRDEDWRGVLEANRAFHGVIFALARNAEAVEILRRNDQLVTALWHRHGYGPSQRSASIAEHAQIVAALRMNDADAAACFAMAHAARAKYDLLSRMAGKSH